MAAIFTDEQLETEVGSMASGQVAGLPQITAVEQNANSVADISNIALGTTPTATTVAATPSGISTTAPTQSNANVGQVGSTTTTAPSIGTMDAAQITPAGAYMADIQGTVSAGSIATAPTEQLDERATTKYQLTQLLSSIEEGTEMPAWASPAVRKVGAIMQARGLGASSMASAAMTQAVMESGVVIASCNNSITKFKW